MDKIITGSNLETKNFAKKLAPSLKGGSLVCLYGDLGAGKTVFAKGIAQALGIEEEVNSPSYTILKIYRLKEKKFDLAHFDFYRLKDHELNYPPADLQDYLTKDYLVLIEWPERVEKFLPKSKGRVNIVIKNIGDNKRELKFKK